MDLDLSVLEQDCVPRNIVLGLTSGTAQQDPLNLLGFRPTTLNPKPFNPKP